MGVTIQVNGLTVAHKGSGGYEKNSAPDVCKTPPHPVPVPYSIISFNRDLQKGSSKVKADGGNSIDIKPSIHSKCTGDEPGSVGGVVSGVNVHQSSWITYSPNVFIEGQNACRQTDKLFMNKKNTIAGQGGNWEPSLAVLSRDPILYQLCFVFCRIENDGRPNKDTRAAEAARNRPEIDDAVRNRYGPNAAPNYQRSVYHPTRRNMPDHSPGRPRKNWRYDMDGLANKLRQQFFGTARRVLGTELAERGGRLLLRAVPFIGWAMTAYDVYDLSTTAVDLWRSYRDNDLARLRDLAGRGYNVYEARPDIAIDVDGQVEAIYDFKFNNQGWGGGQQELYDSILGADNDPEVRPDSGRRAVAVNQESCECQSRAMS